MRFSRSRTLVAALTAATLLVAFLAACGAEDSTSTASPGGSPGSFSASPSSTLQALDPTACRLPLFGYQGVNKASFLSVQDGSVALSPDGDLHNAGTQGFYQTTTQPVLTSTDGDANYSTALGRWVPAFSWHVSSSGTRYAYVQSPGGAIHVVDAMSGDDRVVLNDSQYDIAAFSGEDLYLVHHTVGSDVSSGLWRLDLTSSTLSEVTADGSNWGTIDDRSAWSTNDDAGTGSRATPYALPTNRLLRLDLQTGAALPVFSRPGGYVAMVGNAGDGEVLVTVQTTPGRLELWLVTVAGSSRKLLDLNGVSYGLSYGPVRDEYGTWLLVNAGTATDGVYLLGTDNQMHQVLSKSFSGETNSHLAGGCLIASGTAAATPTTRSTGTPSPVALTTTPSPVVATVQELTAVAQAMFPIDASSGSYPSCVFPAQPAPNTYDSCPIATRLKARLLETDASDLGYGVDRICRCQDFSNDRGITATPLGSGGSAVVTLFGATRSLELIIVRDAGGQLLVDDTLFPGCAQSSLYLTTSSTINSHCQ